MSKQESVFFGLLAFDATYNNNFMILDYFIWCQSVTIVATLFKYFSIEKKYGIC